MALRTSFIEIRGEKYVEACLHCTRVNPDRMVARLRYWLCNNGSSTSNSATGLVLGFNWLPMNFTLLHKMEFVAVRSLLQLHVKQFVQLMCQNKVQT